MTDYLFGRPIITDPDLPKPEPGDIVYESPKTYFQRKAMVQANVTEITEIVEESSLPDGEYTGTWGGYVVRLKHEGVLYELKTDNGIKTMSAPCVVKVKDGKATVRTM